MKVKHFKLVDEKMQVAECLYFSLAAAKMQMQNCDEEISKLTEDANKFRCAVIVNDMADVNVDANLVKSQGQLVQAQEKMSNDNNELVTPVTIPSDPLSILPPEHPAMSILANSTIVVQRQLEMMNVMLGFEQANKYAIMDGAGNHIGYLAEPDGNMLKRQLFKTHRGFTVHVFDRPRESRDAVQIGTGLLEQFGYN